MGFIAWIEGLFERLGKEELVQLILKLPEENLRLKQRVSELAEKLASLPLKGGFRAKLFFKPGVKGGGKRPGQKEGSQGRGETAS